MLLLVTIGLVVVAAAALMVGFVNNQLGPIYVSIVCSALAGLVLVLFSRLSRRHGPAVASAGGPAPLSSLGASFQSQPAAPRAAAPALTPTFGASRPASPPPPPPPPDVIAEEEQPGWADEPWFPIEDYDDMRVAEILPLLPELDLDELDQLREHEAEGKARASVLIRIDELIADLEEVSAGAGPEEDEPQFPIEDYDDLRVSDILPLLSELDDDELEEVAGRERQGMARATILARINRLLGVEEEAAAPVKPAPAAEKWEPEVERMAPAKVAAATPKPAVIKKAAAPVEVPDPEPTPAKKAVAAKAEPVAAKAEPVAAKAETVFEPKAEPRAEPVAARAETVAEPVAAKAETAAEPVVETVEPPPAPAVPVPSVPPAPVPPMSPVPPLAAPGPSKPRLAMKAAASAIKKPPPVKKAVTKQAPAAKRR